MFVAGCVAGFAVALLRCSRCGCGLRDIADNKKAPLRVLCGSRVAGVGSVRSGTVDGERQAHPARACALAVLENQKRVPHHDSSRVGERRRAFCARGCVASMRRDRDATSSLAERRRRSERTPTDANERRRAYRAPRTPCVAARYAARWRGHSRHRRARHDIRRRA